MINRVFSLYADYNRTTLLSISTCSYETHRYIRGCLASLTVWRSFLGCIYKLQIILNLCEVGLYHLRQWVICSNRQKSNHNNTYQNCKLMIHNAEMLNIDLIFRRLLYPLNYFILNFYMCYPTALASLFLSLFYLDQGRNVLDLWGTPLQPSPIVPPQSCLLCCERFFQHRSAMVS